LRPSDIDLRSKTYVFHNIPGFGDVTMDTAPYFYDNSAMTLEAVMRQYQIFFHLTAVGLNGPSFEISDRDAADIIAFLKLL